MVQRLFKNIPEEFWGLFKSINMEIYIEALLKVNEEYLFNDYFLSKENCLGIINDFCEENRYSLSDEKIDDENINEPTASLILNRLLNKFKWLKRNEDYINNITNIVIPDYSAIFIDAFEKVLNPELNESEIYVQNIYSNIYSVVNDERAGIEMLKTASHNIRMLNKSLQDMLHNMDKFFSNLLKQNSYSNLLEEHLGTYVENMVSTKYHILKTSDNFYLYKNNIKSLLAKIPFNERILNKLTVQNDCKIDDVLDFIDGIERGFYNIEKRINNIDIEHRKYIRTTVNKLNYLLNHDEGMKGSIIELMNLINQDNINEIIMDLSDKVSIYTVLSFSKDSFYTVKRKREDFEKTIEDVNLSQFKLSRKEVLKNNNVKVKYKNKEILEFITNNMINNELNTEDLKIETDREFELLILAYDMATMTKSKITAESNGRLIKNNVYVYPSIIFRKRL